MRFLRLSIFSLALAAAFLFVIDSADARVGSGNSSGSRGSRTFNSAPATNTAPKAAPVERSMTQPGAPTAAQGASRPATAAAPSRFGGFGGLLMGGLLEPAFSVCSRAAASSGALPALPPSLACSSRSR